MTYTICFRKLKSNIITDKLLMNSDNGKQLDLKGFKKAILDLRREITNRQMITQDLLFVPADKEGLTGTAAHTAHMTGSKDGKDVDVRLANVETVELIKGRRQVVMESFVLLIEDKK